MKNNNTLTTFLNDIFNPRKSFKEKANKYLGAFKKSYEERSDYENILVECLYNMEFLCSQNARFLGGMEVILIITNYIPQGSDTKFNFEKIEEKFLFIKYKRKETYREHIIRLSKKYLSDNGVL